MHNPPMYTHSIKLRFLIAIAFGVLSGAPAVVGVDREMPSGEIFDTDVSASNSSLIANSKYKIWIPESASMLRAIFVINMRGAGKHLFTADRGMARSGGAHTVSHVVL